MNEGARILTLLKESSERLSINHEKPLGPLGASHLYAGRQRGPKSYPDFFWGCRLLFRLLFITGVDDLAYCSRRLSD